jgi:tetratricopeptide (TPR) repeat protein
LEKSLSLFQDLLAHYKATYGELHHLVGSTLHNIGILHLRLHQNEEALSSFQQAVRVRKGSIGRDHPDVAVSLVKVGITQLLLRSFDDALVTFRDALSVRRHALGHLHPSTARIYNNIGCVHVEFNELREARRAFESALDVQRNALCYEPENMQLLLGATTTLCNLGYLYTHRGAHGKAALVLEEALSLQEKVFLDDPCHPTLLSILDSLADSYGKNGDNVNAVKRYKDIIGRLTRMAVSEGDSNKVRHENDLEKKKNDGAMLVSILTEDPDKEEDLDPALLSARKRRALAVAKYKLSTAYLAQNDFECALQSLRGSFTFISMNTDATGTDTDNKNTQKDSAQDVELLEKVKKGIMDVETILKSTNLNWL